MNKVTKGTYVSRSTYQRVVEENKKLLNDIRILVAMGPPSAEKALTRHKWLTKFEEDRELFELLKKIFGKPTVVDQSKVIRKSPIFIAENKNK